MSNIGIEGKLKPLLQNAKVADAIDVEVEASGFDGNLDTSATNVQLIAQAVDDLTLGNMGGALAASDVSVSSTGIVGVLNGVTDAQTAFERIDGTGVGAPIFRFQGNYSADNSNIAEWFGNRQFVRMQCTDNGGFVPATFTLPSATDLNTAFDALATAGLPEILSWVIEYTDTTTFLSIIPRATPNPQIKNTTSIPVRPGIAAGIEISRVNSVISDYIFTSIGLIGGTGATTVDTIKLINPANATWDASASGTLPSLGVIKGNAYKVINAPSDGTGRFGELMQTDDWVVWEGETFTSWSATPHQWFVLPAHEVRRISALERDFLTGIELTPTSDRNAVTRGANYADSAGEIRLKIYATQAGYTAADLNTTGDIDEYTDASEQTGFLAIRLTGNFSTLESVLPTLYVYADDGNGNFTRLFNLHDDFAFQGDFGAESDYLSNNSFTYNANDTLRIYIGTLLDRFNHAGLDISESNLTNDVQAKLNRTDGGGTDDRARLASLESKVAALFPLTPDVTDLTGWSDIFNPEQSTQTVTITDGYSLIADYRGDATRYESAGVTYSDAGTNVVTYTGLGNNLFRTFGFKVTAVADQVLMWIVDGSERIPYIDMTDTSGTGRYRVNNYTPATVEDQRVTNQTHHITTISGQSTLRAGTADTATITATAFPSNARQTSRTMQIGLDVFVNGVDTQGEHLQEIDIPADLTAQAAQTFTASIYLGPLYQNRTVNVTMSHATRVSGADLLVDIQLVTAPSDVTIRIRDVFVFLNYTAPAAVARVDNFVVLQDAGGDYTFTGTNEILITFHPFESQGFVNVVPVAVNASGTITELNDTNTPVPGNHFGSVEIPDQTTVSGFEFRTFAPEHFLVHSDLSHLLARRTTQWCYGLAELRAVTENAVTEAVDFTNGVVLISPNSTRYKLEVDNSGVLSTQAI